VYLEQNRIERFQLGVTYNDHLVRLPDYFKADQKLKQVIKGIVQISLEQLQAWAINHLSRKYIPVFDRPLGKEMFPNVQSEPHQVQL